MSYNVTSCSSNRRMMCSLRSCCNGLISPKTGRVEICTSLPNLHLYSSLKVKFKIDWKANGQTGSAQFHPDCWANVVKSSRSRSRRADHQIQFIQTEKAMVKEALKTAEQHDPVDTISLEAKRIAEMILSAKHFVAFTGAGISTSAGIGDYRGKQGKWTEDDRLQVVMDDLAKVEKRIIDDDDDMETRNKKQKTEHYTEINANEVEDDNGIPYEDLRPTLTHEALYMLMELGYLKFIISQNGDGLHTLSGVPKEKLSELHGNVFQEVCEKCSAVFDRNFYVMDDISSQYFEELEDFGETDIKKPDYAVKCRRCGLNHRTGRICKKEGCRGYLMDTIINFRDHLADSILDRAEENAKASDLILCLGSTLKVTPANSLVEMGKPPLRLIICNRQKTDIDARCKEADPETGIQLGSRVFGDCDLLMDMVMQHILKQTDYNKWVRGRSNRMQKYDRKRITS